jgi:hypothetical protein
VIDVTGLLKSFSCPMRQKMRSTPQLHGCLNGANQPHTNRIICSQTSGAGTADSRASSTTCILFAPACWGYWKILLIFLTLSKALSFE